MNPIKERVIHTLDPTAPTHIPLFLPRIATTKANASNNGNNNNNNNNNANSDDEEIRPLQLDTDMDRIMDYPNMPQDPPKDALVMHCEAPNYNNDFDDDQEEGKGDDDAGIVFPKRNARMRGGYILLSKQPVKGIGQGGESSPSKGGGGGGGDSAPAGGSNGGTGSGRNVYCIPLAGSKVEFPPGGRRVFREHAHTGARAGYEMAIHVKKSAMGNDGGSDNTNANTLTCFIVLDSLGQREAWAAGIRARCDVGTKDTALRAAGSRFNVMSTTGTAASGKKGQEKMGITMSILGASSAANNNAGGKGKKHWGQLKTAISLSAALQRTAGSTAEQQQVDAANASSGNADLDAAIAQFGRKGFGEEAWLHEFLQQHSVDDLPGECDKLEKWMDVIKNGLRGAVLEQYEYFVEASREMSTMGREVAWLRTLVERQQETLMTMKNIDFGAVLEEIDEVGGEEDGYGYLSDEDGLVLGGGGGIGGIGGAHDNASDASSVVSSSSEEGGPNNNTSSSRTPMRANRRKDARTSKRGGRPSSTPAAEDMPIPPHGTAGGQPPPSSHPSYIEIPAWITDVTEEVSAFIKESRYTDATDLILKAKTEVSDILAMHEQPTPPVVNTPASLRANPRIPPNNNNNNTTATITPPITTTTQKKLHKKQQALLQRTNLQIDALIDRMSKRLSENLRRKNEALKASAKRERADPLSTLAPLASPVCLNDDAVALHLLVKLGKFQEAATAYAARRSLLLSECLHERPISQPIGMDAVIYAAQLSSSFFSSLAMAVDGFLDLFVDSDTGNAADDATLNSRSLFMGGGGKCVPSGALSAIVLWCDSELAKFSNVFGSSRLLGSLSLSPFGMRRHEEKTEEKGSVAKEREHSIEVAAKCVDQAFLFASENLDSIGLPLTPKLAELIRPRLKGCDAEVATLLDSRWKALTFEWSMESNVPEKRLPSRPSTSSRHVASADRRV